MVISNFEECGFFPSGPFQYLATKQSNADEETKTPGVFKKCLYLYNNYERGLFKS